MKTPALWAQQFDQPAQVMCGSGMNGTVVLGGRQHFRAMELTDSGFSVTRSVVQKSNLSTTAVATHPFSPELGVSAASNGEMTIWNYRNLSQTPVQQKWSAHDRTVTSMAFVESDMYSTSSTVAHLITASADGSVALWPVSGDRSKWPRDSSDGFAIRGREQSGARDVAIRKSISTSRTFSLLVACEDGSVENLECDRDERTFTPTTKYQVSTQPVNTVRFCADSEHLFATGSRDAMIRVYDTRQPPTWAACSFRSQSSVWCVRWRPDTAGGFLSSCQSVLDPSVYVWDMRSTHTPAYVFNSHKETVTDFFWVDKCHLLSCAKDGGVHLSRIQDAVIPIEKMRTVNISYTMRRTSRGAVHTISRVCDKVDRSYFESSHAALNQLRIRELGYPPQHSFYSIKTYGKDTEPVIDTAKTRPPHVDRTCHVVQLSRRMFPDLTILSVATPALVKFIKSVGSVPDTLMMVSLIESLAESVRHVVGEGQGQIKCLRLLAWVVGDKGKCRDEWLRVTVAGSIEQYRLLNNLFMCLVLGSFCIFSTDKHLTSLVSMELFITWSCRYVELLRRLELFELAAFFVSASPVLEVRALSHNGTIFKVGCSSCGEYLESSSCKRCSTDSNICSICGDAVLGLWVACQVCGHGGHLKHVQWWLRNGNTGCPEGCGHSCSSSDYYNVS